jgi:hypothetical protein
VSAWPSGVPNPAGGSHLTQQPVSTIKLGEEARGASCPAEGSTTGTGGSVVSARRYGAGGVWTPKFGGDYEPLAYVRRAVTNLVLSSPRRGWGRRQQISGWDLPEGWDGHDLAEAVTDRAWIWSLLGNLGARQRAAIVLRYFHGLPDDAIAEVLGCQPATVRSLISRRSMAGQRVPFHLRPVRRSTTRPRRADSPESGRHLSSRRPRFAAASGTRARSCEAVRRPASFRCARSTLPAKGLGSAGNRRGSSGRTCAPRCQWRGPGRRTPPGHRQMGRTRSGPSQWRWLRGAKSVPTKATDIRRRARQSRWPPVCGTRAITTYHELY